MAFDLIAEEDAPVHLPGRGHDHATLALLPFGVIGEDRRHSPVTVTYQAQVDGKVRRMSVTLSPGPTGLPVPSDQTVFLALLQMAMDHRAFQPRLEFRLNDLVRTLEWTRCGRNYDRLRESLDRLGHMAINVNTAMVARNGSEYRRTEEMAHVIDTYRIETDPSDPKARCWVEWGFIVREAFRLGDIKRLDWELVKVLNNPTATQLYRLLDRVVQSGEQRWDIGWKPLAQAMGMSLNYDRPAKFRAVVEPHIEALIRYEVIDSWDYQRGGRFVFHLHNYIRSQLRRVLVELGVFAEVARQVVAAHDEMAVMAQVDCLKHGLRGHPEAPGGYVVKAVREGYELRYPDDEPERFLALWDLLLSDERVAHHEAALWLCDLGDDLFATRPDPSAWPIEMRAVARFMICWNLDPDQVLRSAKAAAQAAAQN